jgi:hypothetical protein
MKWTDEQIEIERMHSDGAAMVDVNTFRSALAEISAQRVIISALEVENAMIKQKASDQSQEVQAEWLSPIEAMALKARLALLERDLGVKSRILAELDWLVFPEHTPPDAGVYPVVVTLGGSRWPDYRKWSGRGWELSKHENVTHFKKGNKLP